MGNLPGLDALKIGPHAVWPPVELAPMAGITNPAFRSLCREHGAGLYVCEMITATALVARNPKTMRMIRFTEAEHPRSIQLYGVDPVTVGRAVQLIVEEDRADHIDLNFGCPVPKVTRRGGGAAIPWRRELLRSILRAAVTAAKGRVPITMKMRIGIDDEHITYRDAGQIAQEEGLASVALHGRTAAQLYGGQADWVAIADLVQLLDIPVLGNGDIWEADDALRMVEQTGCAGVVIGRGCLGRPWLFSDLACAFDGDRGRKLPPLSAVAATMRRHASLLLDEYGDVQPDPSDPHARDRGIRDFRKHIAWYLKGFAVGGQTRRTLSLVSSLDELDELLAGIPDQPFPSDILGTPRGRSTSARKVALPYGWLEDRDSLAVPEGAELDVSGG
ncbi:MAG: tRNA dihydrouridine synthase DusB [Geodermatophilaceae bacterium]|nr:tRNA dihydrouridine synthase DusB [Geodermatophilaceae bacterium]